MAVKDEEIDETPASSGTVMVGGMDHLVADKNEEIEVEVEEEAKPKPRAKAPSDDDREEDARLAYDVSDDDEIEERGLSRRQRRNRQRKTAVVGRDQVIDQLNAKVDALTNMIGQMGNSQIGLTVQNIDNQLGAANQALTLADAEIKKAVAAGDLARYDELKALKDEAQTRVWQLSRHKNGIVEELRRGGAVRPNGNGQEPAPRQQDGGLDQRTQDFTQTFIERFDFDPNGTDETTLIIKAIDDSVAAEGYRSNTPLYWQTLEKKLAARGIYPASGDDEGDDSPPPRREQQVRKPNGNGGRPPTAGSQSGRRGTGNTFRLDPMMRDYLEGEGILHTEGLNDEQKGRRSRLLKGWQEGQRKLERGEIR